MTDSSQRGVNHTEAGSGSVHLSEKEQDIAHRHATVPAEVLHEIVRESGERELARGTNALLWSGLTAGLSMGLSFMAQALIQAALPDTPWRHLIAAFGYTAGFVVVVLGRQQLFTESTLSAVLPVLTRRTAASATACLRLWIFVLIGNIVGTWIFAAILAYGQPFTPEVGKSLLEIGWQSMQRPFWPVLLSGGFAGWIIALMVWVLPSSHHVKLLAIVFLTYIIALGHFSHIIAGSADAAYAVLMAHASLGDYLMRFFVPTLIGNMIGGVLLVALLNHAPVAPDLENAESV